LKNVNLKGEVLVGCVQIFIYTLYSGNKTFVTAK